MMWLIYALLSATTAALVAIFSKMSSSKVDTITASMLRSIIMTLFLLTIGLVLRRTNVTHLQSIPTKDLLLITLAGISGALSWLFYFRALELGTVSGVVAVDRLSLVIAILLSALLIGEVITLKAWLGVVCIMIGTFLIL